MYVIRKYGGTHTYRNEHLFVLLCFQLKVLVVDDFYVQHTSKYQFSLLLTH